MKAENIKIHIIGGGNLGVALAIGMSKFFPCAGITITRRNIEQIRFLENGNIRVSSDNTFEINQADIILLSVKPYQVDIVLNEILPHIENKIIVSAVSGLSIESLEQKVNNAHAVVRIMPNIAAQFGGLPRVFHFLKRTVRLAGRFWTYSAIWEPRWLSRKS